MRKRSVLLVRIPSALACNTDAGIKMPHACVVCCCEYGVVVLASLNPAKQACRPFELLASAFQRCFILRHDLRTIEAIDHGTGIFFCLKGLLHALFLALVWIGMQV